MARALIIGVDSDIAGKLIDEWESKGWTILGTSRRDTRVQEGDSAVVKLELGNMLGIQQLFRAKQFSLPFDCVLFSAGTLNPIGKFGDNNFHEWLNGIQVNFLGPVQILHLILQHGLLNENALVVVLGGGGVNSAPTNYSSYTIAKLALTKFVELLASEYPSFRFISLGTGWLKTKIHQETLAAGQSAGSNFQITSERLETNSFGDIADVPKFIDWAMQQPSNWISGRNFSLQSDPWKHQAKMQKLLEDEDNFKLRRRLVMGSAEQK